MSDRHSPGPSATPDVSALLDHDEWPLRWQRKLGLVPSDGMGLIRRVLSWAVDGPGNLGFGAWWTLLMLSPLLAFAPKLMATKRHARLDYVASILHSHQRKTR